MTKEMDGLPGIIQSVRPSVRPPACLPPPCMGEEVIFGGLFLHHDDDSQAIATLINRFHTNVCVRESGKEQAKEKRKRALRKIHLRMINLAVSVHG